MRKKLRDGDHEEKNRVACGWSVSSWDQRETSWNAVGQDFRYELPSRILGWLLLERSFLREQEQVMFHNKRKAVLKRLWLRTMVNERAGSAVRGMIQ